MIDLSSFNKSLTIWIKKYFEKTILGKRKVFFDLELGITGGGEAVFLGNLDKTDTKALFIWSRVPETTLPLETTLRSVYMEL